MLVPVFEPPPQVDATNVAEFQAAIAELVARHHGIAIDCSRVVSINGSGMRVIEMAARDAQITLVNAPPAVQLMASAFGVEVRRRGEPLPDWDGDDTEVPRRRLESVETGAQVAP